MSSSEIPHDPVAENARRIAALLSLGGLLRDDEIDALNTFKGRKLTSREQSLLNQIWAKRGKGAG